MRDINKDELAFIVSCVENVGLKLGIHGNDVYKLLTINSHILKNYILPNYEILHTQSKEYIVADIIEFMQAEGEALKCSAICVDMVKCE